MQDDAQYLSADSLASLKEELKLMSEKTIPDIAKRIDEAKQQGDLSENAEYHQAREEMSWAQGRMRELERIINNAVLIKNDKKTGLVSLGSVVMVKINGKDREFTIVGPQESDPSKGKISNESPLGSAFIGAKAGEKIEVSTPAGRQVYQIVKIG